MIKRDILALVFGFALWVTGVILAFTAIGFLASLGYYVLKFVLSITGVVQ